MPCTIASDCKDTINDISYDYFGRRLAICSTDHHIKIFDVELKDDKETWVLTASWKAHNAAVWRLSWAHPEFGQVIASCSLDRQVIIWEEVPYSDPIVSSGSYHHVTAAGNTGRAVSPSNIGGGEVGWIKRATLGHSRASVSDVCFSPRHFGLLLASASYDGSFRIYEANDTMNLSVWSLEPEVVIESDKASQSQGSSMVWLPALSSIAWGTSRNSLPILAVGVDQSIQYGQPENRQFTRPPSSSSSSSSHLPSKLQCWQSTAESTSSGARRWRRVDSFNISERIRDVCFAPSNGRSFHLLAAAIEKRVALYTIRQNLSNRHSHHAVKHLGDFHTGHVSPVCRIRWHAVGSIFLSTDDDGVVICSRARSLDKWEEIEAYKEMGMFNCAISSTIAADYKDDDTTRT